MTSRFIAALAAVLGLAVFVGSNPSVPAAPDPPAGDDGVSVQARGPVHEGYAQPYNAAPKPGPVAPKAPPDPVPEQPPDQKPAGDNVQWVPGYWSWDGDRNDYTWVSGFWRAAPPDRKWVAGYWNKTGDGWQWVSGYWAPATQERPPLLDTPPEPLDAGPSFPAPDENSMYVPGTWVPRNERYAWRPGYWRPARLGLVWVPAHYVWTPGGCVFVDGYWDYPLETRGVLFAPVVFTQPLWETPGWCFGPRYVVDCDADFFASLFVRPSCGDYCFGDYYAPTYLSAGYEPWCRYGPRHYDPLYGYYRWAHRDNPGWLRDVGAVYAGRRSGELARPARTLAEHVAGGRRAGPSVVRPLSDFRGGMRLTTIDRTQVAHHQAAARQVQEAARQRLQLEHSSTTHGRTFAVPSPAHAAPVIVNHSADHSAQHHQEARPPAPVVQHTAHAPPTAVHQPPAHAPPPVVHQPPAHMPPPVVHQPAHAAPAPAVVHHPASHPAPPHAAPPARHASPPPAHAAPAHASPPHHSSPPPAHASAGHGGNHNDGHKKK
jgi:hypothetical protein